MDIERLIEKYQLNKSEESVLRQLEVYRDGRLPSPTIRKIAKETYLSTASIVGMCKKMGLSGYSELIYYMFGSRNLTFDLAKNPTIHAYIKPFNELIEKHATDCWSFIGIGLSANLVQYMAERANLQGFRATSNAHLELIRPNVSKNSLVFAVSNSGETEVVNDFVQMAHDNGVAVISFVGDERSTLAKLSTLVIPTQTFSTYSFQDYYPQLFFGNALNMFELLMSAALIHLSDSSSES